MKSGGHGPWPMLLGGLLLATAGCGREPAPRPMGPPAVTVATPVVRDITEYYYYTGTLAAVQNVDIRARVQGFLESIDFEPSTDVEKGALLFQIEHEPYEIAVATAEAGVAQAKALQDQAQSIYDRVLKAYNANAATDAERIESFATLEQRKAETAAAEANLRDAKLNLEYTYVRSPIAGRVSRNLMDVGDLVGYNEPTLLTTVVQMDPIWVYFDVSERIVLEYLERRDTGQVDPERDKAELALANNPDGEYPFKGVLDFVDNQVDPQTGTIRVRAVFPNKEGALFPGLFARVRAPYGRVKDALLVEENAILTGLQGQYVLVVKPDNTVEQRVVELGPRDGAYRMVREGLTAEDHYVVRGIQKAIPGQPVMPQMQTADQAPPAPAASADINEPAPAAE